MQLLRGRNYGDCEIEFDHTIKTVVYSCHLIVVGRLGDLLNENEQNMSLFVTTKKYRDPGHKHSLNICFLQFVCTWKSVSEWYHALESARVETR